MDKNILLQIESEFRKQIHILDRVEILRELALEQIEKGLITNEILKRIRVCVTDNIDQDETIMATTVCVAHTQGNAVTNEVTELYRIPEIHLTESLLNDFPIFYILQVLIHEFGHCIHYIYFKEEYDEYNEEKNEEFADMFTEFCFGKLKKFTKEQLLQFAILLNSKGLLNLD